MILWHMGRGVSYSALVTALLAAACLALSVPGKRHQQQQAWCRRKTDFSFVLVCDKIERKEGVILAKADGHQKNSR